MLIKYFNNFYRLSLHRQLLEERISQCASLVKGNVLDAGSKNRRYDSFFKNAGAITAVDIKPQEGKNIIAANIINLPFKKESFDTAISFEVLEYVTETGQAIQEFNRVLKKGGLLIFSVPFLDPVHGDIDSVRYTMETWERMLKNNFEIEQIFILGGRYSAMWDFFFEKARNRFRTIYRLMLFPILAIFKKIALYLDKKEKNWRFPMGYFFICRRK